MRIQVVTAGACALVALAACSSSSSTPGSGSTGSSGSTGGSSGTVSAAAFCQQLKTTSSKLSGLSSDINNPTQLGKKLAPLVSQLQQLKNGAPPQVAPALQDLLTAMQGAAKAANGGNLQQLEKQMQTLVPKLSKDFQKLESYVAANCH